MDKILARAYSRIILRWFCVISFAMAIAFLWSVLIEAYVSEAVTTTPGYNYFYVFCYTGIMLSSAFIMEKVMKDSI